MEDKSWNLDVKWEVKPGGAPVAPVQVQRLFFLFVVFNYYFTPVFLYCFVSVRDFRYQTKYR